jgi:hypothetical protein
LWSIEAKKSNPTLPAGVAITEIVGRREKLVLARFPQV